MCGVTVAITRIAIIANPKNPNTALYLRTIEPAAPGLRLTLRIAGVNDAAGIEQAIAAAAGEANGCLLIMPDPLTIVHRELIVVPG